MDYFRELFNSTSVDGAAERLAAAICGFGYSRVCVAHFSFDKNYLVLKGVAGFSTSKEMKNRIKRSCKQVNANQYGACKAWKCYTNLYEKDQIESWLKQLNLPVSAHWFEVPIFTTEQEIGIVMFDELGGKKVRNKKVVELKICDYVRAYAEYCYNNDCLYERKLLNDAESIFNEVDLRIANVFKIGSEEKLNELNEMFEFVAKKIVSETGADLCDISLFIGGVYKPVARAGVLGKVGLDISENESNLSESITLKAIKRKRKEIFVGKRYDSLFMEMKKKLTDESELYDLSKLRSWGAIPIFINGQVPGALSIASKDFDFFNLPCIHILELFTHKLSLLLQMEKSYQTIEDRFHKQEEKIKHTTLELTEACRRSGYTEAARILVHSLSNMLQPIGTDIQKISSLLKDFQDGTCTSIIEELEKKFEKIENVFKVYRSLRSNISQHEGHRLDELIETSLSFCISKAKTHGIDIYIRRPLVKTEITCSSPEMLQAIINIIANAIDAMVGVPGKKVLNIRVFEQDNNVIVKFEDTGIGIRAKHLSKVEEPGFTTKQDKGGTGLGIPHVRQIISAIGGELHITSKYRKGTSVELKLPIRRN